MTTDKFYNALSFSLIVLLGYLTYQILQPFLNAIAWAVVFAIVFYPVYAYLLKYVRVKSIASFITVVIITLVILGPFTYLSFILIDEIGGTVQSIDKGTLTSFQDAFTNAKLTKIVEKIQSYMGMEGIDMSSTITEAIKKTAAGITNRLSAGITNIAGMLFDFFFMLLALFFFLRDGPDFLATISDYAPFSEENKRRLIAKIKDMVISTVFGGVIVALIQGIIGGTTFHFLGISSPVLWGASISVMSFLPLLGTFAIWGPMTGYLFIEGDYVRAVILLLVGVFGISMVDNILKPIIISGRTKMPTLAVFFSVLGGIKLFGFIGFIIGPLVLALFISVFEIFRHTEEGGEHA